MILITQLETYKLIRHPLTWWAMSLSLCLAGLLFCRLCVDHHQLAIASLQQRELSASLTQDVIKPLCSWMMIIFALIFPLLTTYAFSQEYRQRTFYLFANSSHKPFTLVFGKFLSLVAILFALQLMMLFMIATLSFETSLNWGMIALSFLAVYLVTCSIISFGLCVSSLIGTPLLAMGITMLGNMVWLLLEWLDPFPLTWSFLAKELSLLSHSTYLLNGMFHSADLIYYLVFNGFWLSLCIRAVRHKMIRMPG